MFSSELSILSLYGLLVLLTLVLQVLPAMAQVGLPKLAGPRDDMPRLTGMAGRLSRCLDNSVVALALFAPAVLSLVLQEATTATTLLACQVFLVARLLYVPIYAAGIPWLRTLVWAVGFVMTAWLYLIAL